MLRILIADDHGLYRRGLSITLTTAFEDSTVLEAGSLDAALSLLAMSPNADLILLDLHMPGFVDFGSLKIVRKNYPNCRIVILSASEDREDILSSLGAGLHGYISKAQSDEDIVAAVRDILRGRIYVPPILANLADPEPDLLAPARSQAPATMRIDLTKMTRRQQEVLPLMARGMSNKEIARALNLAETTVKIHMAALLRVLNVRNRTEAALMAHSILRSP